MEDRRWKIDRWKIDRWKGSSQRYTSWEKDPHVHLPSSIFHPQSSIFSPSPDLLVTLSLPLPDSLNMKEIGRAHV